MSGLGPIVLRLVVGAVCIAHGLIRFVPAPPGAAATVRSAVSEAIRSARQPPRSPPRVEDLCADTNTSPAELQSVVDGLMLIAGAVPPSTS